MRFPEFLIIQGQDCYLELGLPFEVDDTSDVVCVVFSQNDSTILEFDINTTAEKSGTAGAGSVTVNEGDEKTLDVHMTQADTLKLERGDVELQVRVKTADGADTFVPLIGRVGRSQRGGVI